MSQAKPSLCVGLSGCRGVGKDSLYACLSRLEPRCARFAFAAALKATLAPMIHAEFGYDPDHLTSEQKEVVRPLFIGFGMAHRAHDPLHWVSQVINRIDEYAVDYPYVIPIVTDFRFENEVRAFRERYGAAFRLINLVRDGAPPPTEEEEKHYRQVAAMADHHLIWGRDSEDRQLARAREVMGWLGLAPAAPPLPS